MSGQSSTQVKQRAQPNRGYGDLGAQPTTEAGQA